uniref:Putative secreted protein n=1 Tax=Panstrongylus lignarius TaxID=156445 RepID=A0A224Y3H6_9HEMI
MPLIPLFAIFLLPLLYENADDLYVFHILYIDNILSVFDILPSNRQIPLYEQDVLDILVNLSVYRLVVPFYEVLVYAFHV